MKIRNRTGPKTDPCGTPDRTADFANWCQIIMTLDSLKWCGGAGDGTFDVIEYELQVNSSLVV